MLQTHAAFVVSLAFATILSFFAAPSYADTFNVNSTADTHDIEPGNGICADEGGMCTLRAAIEEANALSGKDTINVPSGMYALSLGSLRIFSDVDLLGGFWASSVIDGTENEGVQNILVCNDPECGTTNSFPEVSVSISNVTVQNAVTDSFGGAGTGAGISVLPGAILYLSDSIVRNNLAMSSPGGGIANAGVVELLRVRVTDNATTIDNGGGQMQSGGGIVNYAGAKLYIRQSAITQNKSTRGGGIRNGGGFLEMRNVTVSNNSATRRGGGLLLAGVTHISFSTITENILDPLPGAGVGLEARGGGGVHNEGLLLFATSILADNIDTRSPIGDSYSPDCYSLYQEDDSNAWETDFFSFRGNIIGIQDPQVCFILDYKNNGLPVNDIIGTEQAPEAPLLGPLQFNGGLTENHRLLPGSPALDFGKGLADAPIAYCPEEDQRGFVRLVGGNTVCDSGAYEITEEASGKMADAPTNDTPEADAPASIPGNSFALENYPDPFNPATRIRFSIAESEHVRLDVYNMLGQHVRTLVNSVLSPGAHEVAFDATSLPSGTYLYRLQTPSGLETKQMLLIK